MRLLTKQTSTALVVRGLAVGAAVGGYAATSGTAAENEVGEAGPYYGR
jgi:hypothetical protein